jgi:hypothetical protein
MLVHAYATLPGKAKRSAPHHTIKMLHFVLFLSVTCYTSSIVSCIHVNTTKLYNITCTLVATGVILWSLGCSSVRSLMWTVRIYPWRLQPNVKRLKLKVHMNKHTLLNNIMEHFQQLSCAILSMQRAFCS